jgi:hypothetical protein
LAAGRRFCRSAHGRSHSDGRNTQIPAGRLKNISSAIFTGLGSRPPSIDYAGVITRGQAAKLGGDWIRRGHIMHTTTYCVAGFAKAATENAPQRKGLFVRILHSLQQSRIHEARRVIVKYAHLLPEGQKAANVLPFVAADHAHFG